MKNAKGEESIEKIEKELKVILDVQKFWKAKAEQKGKMNKMSEDKEKMEIKKLNNLIAEKRE